MYRQLADIMQKTSISKGALFMSEFSLKEIVSAEDIQARVKQLAQEIDDHCQKEGIDSL